MSSSSLPQPLMISVHARVGTDEKEAGTIKAAAVTIRMSVADLPYAVLPNGRELTVSIGSTESKLTIQRDIDELVAFLVDLPRGYARELKSDLENLFHSAPHMSSPFVMKTALNIVRAPMRALGETAAHQFAERLARLINATAPTGAAAVTPTVNSAEAAAAAPASAPAAEPSAKKEKEKEKKKKKHKSTKTGAKEKLRSSA